MKEWMLLFLSAFTLTGCSDPSPPSPPPATYALAESGESINLAGEWHSNCRTYINSDYKQVIRITGDETIVDIDRYLSNNGTCTTLEKREKDIKYFRYPNGSGADTDEYSTSTVVWRNAPGDTAIVPAPNGLAGPPLSDSPRVSNIDVFSGVPFFPFKWNIYVDDTDAENGNYAFYFAEKDPDSIGYDDAIYVTLKYTKVK